MKTTHAKTERTTTATPSSRLHATKNDIPADARAQIVRHLNQSLADCLDLQSQCKQAHWNVKGDSFIALHKLFDKIFADVVEYSDLIAERAVQLGGTAEGTASVIAERSQLLPYPTSITDAADHVNALSDALAQFGKTARKAIDKMDDLEDQGTADLFTEISRGVDKWLWFVEAHLPAQAESDTTAAHNKKRSGTNNSHGEGKNH